MWFDKSKNPWKWVAGLGLPLVLRTQPWTSWCLILEDLQTLHIPTNKKLLVWTQYRLVLLINFWGKGRFMKKPEKSQAWKLLCFNKVLDVFHYNIIALVRHNHYHIYHTKHLPEVSIWIPQQKFRCCFDLVLLHCFLHFVIACEPWQHADLWWPQLLIGRMLHQWQGLILWSRVHMLAFNFL